MARPLRRRPLPTGRIDGYPPTELSWSRLKKLRLYNTVICKSSRWLTIIAGWNCADGRPSIPAKLAVGITVSPLILFEQRFTSIWGTWNDNISGDGDTHTFWREIHKYLGNFKWLYVIVILILFEEWFIIIWGISNDNISGDSDTHTFWKVIHNYLGSFNCWWRMEIR